MVEDRLEVLDLGVPVESSTRISSQLKGSDSQCIALCHKTRVVTIANGRFVDVYGICNNRLHPFAFLHQISISDHVSRLRSSSLKGDISPDLESVVTTCVSFPVPGFLLVGALLDVPESEISGTESTVFPVLLLGFRLYAGSATQFTDAANSEKLLKVATSVQVYFSFVEPVVGVGGKSIRSMQGFRHDMTPDAGSVLILLEDSKVFGVFSWKERFSDRQVCLAQIKQSDSLVTAEFDHDGRYLLVGDANGRLSLINFRDFQYDVRDISSKMQQNMGKRLELSVCSRSGVIARDNPLEHVRIVHTLGINAIESTYTSLRWWMCNIRDQQKLFILAGKQDGSLSILKLVQGNDEARGAVDLRVVQIYPGLASGTHDAVRTISEPIKYVENNSEDAAGFEFHIISEMRWRTWRIKITEVGDEPSKRYRLIWPSVRDSLGFPSFMIPTKSVKSVVLLPSSSEFAKTLANPTPDHTFRYPISLAVTAKSLQVVGLLTKAAVETVEASSEFERENSEQEKSENDEQKLEREEAQEEVATIELEETRVEEPHPSGPTTLQDKYKLPPMQWKAKKTVAAAANLNEDRSTNQDGVSTSKLNRVVYNERVTSVTQRVETLSGVMKSMRTSFQLFSSDVQHHMNLISEQIEEINRRRVT
ncbi:hypothetical protein L914_05651 [Phytophthora nicotianae]|uniref:Uncharacterized protein n=1 Tax=Phytophthora nicotianae TaxID=4792 RepID=W2NQU5_PHYNI|nr:hypothetical protein L914_05651 [Phytophthora nicotianae]